MGIFLKFTILVAVLSVGVIYFKPDLDKVVSKYLKTLIAQINAGPGGTKQETKSTKTEAKTESKTCLQEGERLFTPSQLARFDGSADSEAIYLGFLGTVYDVTKGAHHYKPGGSYSFFAGKDATRAFLTGEFDETGLSDNLDGLEIELFGGIQTWLDLYDNDYYKIGKVVGYFYDNRGCETKKLSWVQKQIKEFEKKKDQENDESKIFPFCNSEWIADLKEGKVWCTKSSGGIERDWVGVPRQLFIPATRQYRCACVKNFGPPTVSSIDYADEDNESTDKPSEANVGDLNNSRLKEYPNCDPKAVKCAISD